MCRQKDVKILKNLANISKEYSMKVYALISYNVENPWSDDQEIVGIFSTYENAEKAEKSIEVDRYEELGIEEFDLDPEEYI